MYATTIQPLLYVAWHTFVIYAFLIAMLQVLGRRTLGQLTVIDLVVIVVLGSAVETAMVAGNTTLPAGLVSVAMLLILNRALTAVFFANKRLRHLVSGSPILLIHFGHFEEEHLKRTGLTRADVLQSLRARGYCSAEEVKFAVLETDGTINVVPMETEHGTTPPMLRPAAEAEGQV